MTGIDSATLCRVAGIKPERLRIWIHRSVIVAPPDHRYDMAQAFGVALLARRLDRQESPDEAARHVLGQLEAIGGLIRAIAAGGEATASRCVLVDARLANGDAWRRLCTNDQDLERLVAVVLRRGVAHLEIDDVTELYVRVMGGFRHARAEPAKRSRVPA